MYTYVLRYLHTCCTHYLRFKTSEKFIKELTTQHDTTSQFMEVTSAKQPQSNHMIIQEMSHSYLQ